MNIRPARSEDAPQIADIYNRYITTSHATFELDPLGAGEMLLRMEQGWASDYPFLVCEQDRHVVGFAYGRQFRPRPAYCHSIEVSVYVRPGHERKNVATLLYETLFAEIRKGDFHVIIAGISLPNDASVALHEKFAFEKVAHFYEVGRKFDRWIDVAYWELVLLRAPK